MKKLNILFFLVASFFSFGQSKIKIIDSETSNPIPNARIFTENKNFYTNEEGFALLSEKIGSVEVIAFGYEPEKITVIPTVIKLKPLYNRIDEVRMVAVDFQKILKSVLDHYPENYYSSPAIYDVTVKQKSEENNNLTLLMVADGKFWTSDGMYNAKKGYSKDFDSFVQLQIDDLRYLKTKPLQNTTQTDKKTVNHENIGDLFLSYELFRTGRLAQMKNAKTSGRLLYEKGDEQQIAFSIKADSSFIYTGKFNYNKRDNAISYFELDFTQNKSAPITMKDENGKEFKKQLGDGNITFEYYKKEGKYFPAKVGFSTNGFKIIKDDKTYEYSSSRDITFRNQINSDKKGLPNPVKINERYWNNLKISEDKGGIILTKEEQDFLNEKNEK